MALQPWRKGIVTRIAQETDYTRRFWIRIPELPSFDFTPGQFVTLDLPIDDKPGRRLRSYSIASWPDGSNLIELVIVLLEGGAGTTYLFNEIKEGAELTLRGPQGVFTLPQSIESDLMFICTGTGIAPFRSMMHYMHLHQVPHKNVYLVFGTRTQKDLLYYTEMKALAAKEPGFHFIPTLSRDQWEGCCGYVHPVYEQIIKEKQNGSTELPLMNFMLCGWKVMIDEAKERLLRLGYSKKEIHQELYG